MRRFTLNIALSSLFLSGMLMMATPAQAQRRGEGRSENRTESRSNRSSESRSSFNRERSSSSSRAETRSSSPRDNRMSATQQRGNSGNSVINRSSSRNTGNSSANNWPSANRTNTNTSRSDRQAAARSDQGRRSLDVRNNGTSFDNNNIDRGFNNRPSDNRNGNNRPSDNRNFNSRPGDLRNGARSNAGYHIGNGGPRNYAPDHHGVIRNRPASWHAPVAPPHRVYRPVCHHIVRPVIPRGWHPVVGCPIIDGILGLRFGCGYINSLDYLYGRGYEIDGYYNGIVYLRNIQEMHYFWPDVMLNYGTNELLSSAEFHYSTAYDDLGRFNRLYKDLCSRYGQPVNYNETRSGIESVWYGGNARGFVTLEYYYNNGRYYTTLAYGN